MRIKSFYAETVESAMQQASREMGEDALILNTRPTPLEFVGFGAYEVVCAVAESSEKEDEPAEDQTHTQAGRHPSIFWFAGPSGQGKSLSCLRAALRTMHHRGSSVAVVTWDCSRVEGVGVTRSYCDLAGLPWRSVESGTEFQSLLHEWSTIDCLFIDTPAFEGPEELLKDLVRARFAHSTAEVHLVLSATNSTLYTQKALVQYEVLRPTHLLPTHLDEASFEWPTGQGEALPQLPIRWFSMGRAVPDDFSEMAGVPAVAAERPAVVQPAIRLQAEESITKPVARTMAQTLTGIRWRDLLRRPVNGKQNAA